MMPVNVVDVLQSSNGKVYVEDSEAKLVRYSHVHNLFFGNANFLCKKKLNQKLIVYPTW
jgi:hypothetical protein